MVFDFHYYRTEGGIRVSRSITPIAMESATEDILSCLDSQRGGLLTSSYEYPGRYKRWAIGFTNPPLELSTRGSTFTVTAHNDRGLVLLSFLVERLSRQPQLCDLNIEGNRATGTVRSTDQQFVEEDRSRQPSVFTVVREILQAFASHEDNHLGLYGAFGYDLVFQFETITQRLERASDQRDLVLFLPDELVIVDYYLQRAFLYQYEFETQHGNTDNRPRTGQSSNYLGAHHPIGADSDHAPGEYANQVETALNYFRRGDLFEVVPSQRFTKRCEAAPSQLFRTLQQINPSPYGFLLNLGGEYLIGASPEMFVRVEGRRVETCPISGTIIRGQTAIDDAEQIRLLLNSHKDEAELTMCTDVDRNDKSRICEPGSVQVIGRRQIELYSHLIHTVDHVEGLMRPGFDALDAFLTHTWAVTVTGAPKRAAIQFIEQHEQSARRWYGGAVGYLTFDGNLNTGLILRTMRLQNAIAEVRVGATVLYDSIPEDEECETLTKAAAVFEAIRRTQSSPKKPAPVRREQSSSSRLSVTAHPHPRILLIDYEDSFVHTLANYLRQTGAIVTTHRHGFPESLLETERPDLVVLSPGPGNPQEFRVPEMVDACIRRQLPIFGVCLGLQGIVQALGGELGTLDYPQHGKSSRIFVTTSDSRLFRGMPTTLEVGRYHSLFAQPQQMPSDLVVTAISDDEVIMAIEHRTLPIAAVQFHPESIMTLTGGVGLTIIQNAVHALTESALVAIGSSTLPTL
jgi:anthranilate synthase